MKLREAGVTYLKALGRFTDPHTIECTDDKGKKKVITAAHIVIAVGGRPLQLSCPGAELAITSDDLFSLEKAPGRTCVVGAGYVALECAGFVAGLNRGLPAGRGEVLVLVRSVPLRGFDRDVAERVAEHLRHKGVRTQQGLPSRIEKLPSGRLLVSFSGGEPTEEFDTVLAAIGRCADTDGLGLPAAGLSADPYTGKLVCQDEHTVVSHIHAVGDVVLVSP